MSKIGKIIEENIFGDNDNHADLVNAINNKTEYDSKYCEAILALYRRGYSLHQVAQKIGIGIIQYKDWLKNNQEFANAHYIGLNIARGVWDGYAQENLKNSNFQSRLWYDSYKQRFNVADDSAINIKNFDAILGYKHNVNCVLEALANGELSPVQSNLWLDVLQKAYNITEVDNIKSELESIKEQIKDI